MTSLMSPAGHHGPQLLDEIYAGRGTHLRAHRLLTVVAGNPQRPPGWEISQTLWDYLARDLDHPDLLTVGLTACGHGDYRAAGLMLDAVDPMAIPAKVFFQIGKAAYDVEDVSSARRWLLRAVGSGDADVAALAMLYLGVLEETAWADDAREWYLRAVGSGNAIVAATAMLCLGSLEKRAGRVDDAREWLLKAADSGHANVAARAMLSLGDLEERESRVNEARGWYIKALGAHHPDIEPRALHHLGDLAKETGQVRSARRWYLKAVETGHPSDAPQVMLHLGELEKEASHEGYSGGCVEVQGDYG